MSLGEEHNPYAAPQSELRIQSASVQSGPAVLYPMSPLKAAIMSMLTFSIYDVVFWYQHWKRLKESGQDVSPIARAIFAPFTAFGFLTTLSSLRFARGLESGPTLRASPFVYLGVKLASRIADKVLEDGPNLVVTAIACAVSAWVLATIQHGVNDVLKTDNYRGPSNSGASWGAIVAGVIGLLLWFLGIIGVMLPESMDDLE